MLKLLWVIAVGLPLPRALGLEPPLGARVSHPARYEFQEPHLGTLIKITLYADTARIANRAAGEAFGRIRELNSILSDYEPESELLSLSGTAGSGRWVPVSEELWDVLSYAQTVSQASGGAFDVSVGPVVRLWRRARKTRRLPDPGRLAEARKQVGYQHVHLDKRTKVVRLASKPMRLDLGGLAKGYIADQVLLELRRHGVPAALVDAGGDLVIGDAPPGRKGWKIAVAPLLPEGPPAQRLVLANCGIATSGDAWQFVVIESVRYSHIIDPRSGTPITDRFSVSVVAANGIVADAWASAVSVMGIEAGIRSIEQLPETEAFFVRAVNGQVRTMHTNGWEGQRSE